jgi:elongation factor G
MDRIGADPPWVIREMDERLKTNALALQLPIGSEGNFVGVVDLITLQVVTFDGEFGETVRREQVPVELHTEATKAGSEMLEAIALVDEPSLERLLAEGNRALIRFDSQFTVQQLRT